MTMELLVGALILGLIPGAIAHSRGLPFVTWWLYGALIWPVALIHVFVAKPGSVTIAGEAGARRCPFCAETILPEAKVCKHCHRDLPALAAAPARRPVRRRSLRDTWWDREMAPATLLLMFGVIIVVGVAAIALVLWRVGP